MSTCNTCAGYDGCSIRITTEKHNAPAAPQACRFYVAGTPAAIATGDYKAIYKCRLCGQVYYAGILADQDAVGQLMLEMVAGIVGTVRGAPTKQKIHECGGQYAGSLGLADFQGWKCEAEQ